MNESTDQSAALRWRGILEIALSGLGFGFLGIFSKLLFASGMTVGELLATRFCVAALLLCAGLLAFSRARLILPAKQIAICALLGVLGYSVFSTLYLVSIKGTTVALASLLLYTYPVMITLASRFLLSENLSSAQWLALPVTTFGLGILLHGDTHVDSYWAVAAGLGSALCYTLYIIASNRLQPRVDPLTSGLYIIAFAGLGHLVIHRPDITRVASFTAHQWVLIAGICLVSTVGPMVLFLSGLQKLGNTETSILSTMEPLTAVAAGALLFGEEFTLFQAVGGSLILGSLVVTMLSRPSSRGRA